MLLSNRKLTILARGIAVLALLSSALYAQTPLQITTASPLPSGTVGSAYAVGLQAQGGNQPYSWSATGQLPPGLTLLSSGVISGTPTATGTFSFTVSVRDSSGVSASKQLSVTIGGTGGSTVSITTRTLPAGVVGQPYSQQISATGGTGTYTFTATGLPAGLTLSSSGLLSGTPTAPGNFTLSVQAKDTGNGSATASLTLAIQAAPLSITTVAPLFAGTVGTPYSQPFSAIGGVLPYAWSILSGNTDGLTLDAATGNLAGTPQSVGTFNFTVQVADKNGSVASGSYSLVV